MAPWETMRFTIGGARLQGCDEDQITARKVLRLATIEAARNIGLGDLIGSLEPGKKADVIILNISKPHLQPVFDDIIATLVSIANGNDVETVLIDGRLVVDNGKVCTVDEQQVISEGSQLTRNLYPGRRLR
jgi:5-methylthioadenosine/S-adenosylhomocysteine deaminase